MDKLARYRQYVEEVLRRHYHPEGSTAEVEQQLICDRERDHYQLMVVGWRGEEPVYGCTLHLDIKDGKIWIQRDFTEIGAANELLELGVPKEDIVLAFHAPYKRQFTEFAAA